MLNKAKKMRSLTGIPFFPTFHLSFIECKCTSNRNFGAFDGIEWTTLQIRNENLKDVCFSV